MLRPRIIPSLLINEGALVKTINFANEKYLGDPLNTVRIFNEKEVDELIISDISATTNKSEPNYQLISDIASECRMPICYGGGIKNISHIEKIISLGVEKVALSSAAINNPELIRDASNILGSQSIVVVLDMKKSGIFKNKFRIYTHRGKKLFKENPINLIKKIQELGAGELVINSIDKDGTRTGYDHELISYVKEHIKIPLTIIGGCDNKYDMKSAIEKFGLLGLGAGSLFVLKGKYRAVLIQYLNTKEKNFIFSSINLI